MKISTVIAFSSLLFITGILDAQILPPVNEPLVLDYKIHDINKIRQVITNLGYLGYSCMTPYGGYGKTTCEYPIGSGHDYLYSGAPILGGIRGNKKLFSTADAWSNYSEWCAYEFYPTAEPWDTIWVVNRGETADIPYFPNYIPLADQDFVCRYNDHQIFIPDQVEPLYLDVIQITHAWSSSPYDEWILFEFYVTTTRDGLTDAYMGFYGSAILRPAAPSSQYIHDDQVYYDAERNMGVVEDLPGNNDDTIPGPVGYIVFPPEGMNHEDLTWTFDNYLMCDHYDDQQYDAMSKGYIHPPSTDGSVNDGHGFFRLSFGPLNMDIGDTIHFFVGEIFGTGKNNFLENADRLIKLKSNNFKTPFAPPPPAFRVSTSNHAVTLNWEPQSSDVNPETYEDPYRFDNSEQPFEGYRIYKSAKNIGGPWTLLKEVDLPDNIFYANTGLEYEYTDVGLVNNLEYYYTVTAFSKPDTASNFPSQESSKSGNAKIVTPGTETPQTVGQVAVVPNPYRGDIAYYEYRPPWERPSSLGGRWMEQDRRIQFINLPSPCEIIIYTLAGDLVNSIYHNNSDRGFADWNLTSKNGQTVSSGIYLFSVENKKNGDIQVGKFVIIK